MIGPVTTRLSLVLCNDLGSKGQAAPLARIPQSQRRPARATLPFVPYEDWDPDQSYDEQPPTCVRYTLEWKLTLNRRAAAKQTEDGLVLAPSSFWKEQLSSKIADIVKSTSKSYEPEATTIVISVNDRSERDITKRFEKLQIDWPIIERQLQAWSHLLRIGKKLRISVALNYVESKAARTAGRGDDSHSACRIERSGRCRALPHGGGSTASSDARDPRATVPSTAGWTRQTETSIIHS